MAQEYAPPKERGPKSPVFRWGFMVFVAAWMFVLGIIVGRYATPVDFDPERIEKELAELRAAEIQKEKAQLTAEAKALYDMDLDFYKDLQHSPGAAGSPAADQPPADHMDEPPASSREVKRPQSTKSSALARQDRKIVSPAAARTQASPPSSSPTPSPASRPAASKPAVPAGPPKETGRFAIQVASFVAASDADRTVAMLKQRGYAGAYRTEDDVPGLGVRYRVKIGQFGDSESAREALAQLRDRDKFRDAYLFRSK